MGLSSDISPRGLENWERGELQWRRKGQGTQKKQKRSNSKRDVDLSLTLSCKKQQESALFNLVDKLKRERYI